MSDVPAAQSLLFCYSSMKQDASSIPKYYTPQKASPDASVSFHGSAYFQDIQLPGLRTVFHFFSFLASQTTT